jgi:chromosome segregation ATPase
MIEKFEDIEKQRSVSSGELEQKLSEKNIQLIELENEVMKWKQRNEDTDLLLKEKDELVKQVSRERDNFSEKREELLKEKASFESELTLVNNHVRQLVEELNESKEDIMNLRSKAEEDEIVKEEFKKALCGAQEEMDKSINRYSAEVMKLEQSCERLSGINEKLEGEKRRLQEVRNKFIFIFFFFK